MSRKKQIVIVVIICLLVLSIGLSYAYYSVGVQGLGNINVEASATTATLGEVEFNGENTFDTTNIGREIYPGFIGVQEFSVSPYRDGQGIYEVDLAATVPQAFGNDIKLTLYKTTNKTSNHIDSEEGSLTVVNGQYTKQDILNITGTLEKVYEAPLVNTSETMLEQVEFIIANNAFTKPIVTPDGYVTYYAVYEYLDNGNQNNQQGLNFSSKITVKYITEKIHTAADTLAILHDLNSNLTVTQSTSSNPDFSIIAPRAANVDNDGKAEQTSGLFEAQDDYGTSYYFRGDVTNNYVKFGEWQTDFYDLEDTSVGYKSLSECQAAMQYFSCTKYAEAGDDMYWRIIRINGDGSVRLMYDGTSAHSKNDHEFDDNIFIIDENNIRSIGTSVFNENRNDNAYVGYMYGTTGSSTYAATHANTNDSDMKAYLDSWYQSQMMGYASYISDTLFCNDRSVADQATTNYYNTTGSWTNPFGLNAYGTNSALYGIVKRFYHQNILEEGNQVTLMCPQKSDRFTVSDTTIGNGALTYPIGLITGDELNMAGAVHEDYNVDYYAFNGNNYRTMQPFYYGDSGVVITSSGGAFSGVSHDAADEEGNVRPVINLKWDAIKYGSGTMADPFRVE